MSTVIGATATGGSAPSPARATVVGVIESFSWSGGVGDLLKVDFWVSQANATTIKAAQQSTLTMTNVNSLSWLILSFDQEKKVWFEQSYPAAGPVSGIVGPRDNPELNVDLTGAPAKDGIDVMVYKVHMSVPRRTSSTSCSSRIRPA